MSFVLISVQEEALPAALNNPETNHKHLKMIIIRMLKKNKLHVMETEESHKSKITGKLLEKMLEKEKPLDGFTAASKGGLSFFLFAPSLHRGGRANQGEKLQVKKINNNKKRKGMGHVINDGTM